VLLGDLRDGLALRSCGFGGDRVLQVVVDEGGRLRGDEGPQVVEVDREALRRGHVAVGQGRAAQVLDLRFVDGEARVGVEHALPRVHDGLQELRDDGLAAGRHDDVVRPQLHAALSADLRGERLTQLRDPGTRAVARPPVRDRRVHRLDDVGSSGQVDVAQVEREHPIAAGLPVRGGLRDGERRLRAQVIDPSCDPHGRLLACSVPAGRRSPDTSLHPAARPVSTRSPARGSPLA
jgi:hypothetical protein